jgi:dihydroorotate dehydrogenase electron transfer subunit
VTTPAQNRAQRHRNTIFLEEGSVENVTRFAGDQFILQIKAPQCAATAQPGSFVHLTCSDTLPLRRPLSIMRIDGDRIEILYKIVGDGLRHLSTKVHGDTISVLGPIGQPFRPSVERPRPLLIGGGVGIPPMIFLADTLRRQGKHWAPVAIVGSELPFPFASMRSKLPTAWLHKSVDRTMPLLEAWGIPCRLATQAGFIGCYAGFVTELAEQWLASLTKTELESVEIFSCGPTPMLKSVAALAVRYDLPCQVSLEEFMACAVGGCAGCTVQVRTPNGPAMKRVCVDGPVFDAASIEW